MNTPIYVSGHVNPDMDCTVASYSYAYFKNKLDPANTYIPVRCGALNAQTKKAFELAGITPPELFKSIRPHVGDVVRTDYQSLSPETPVLEAARIFYEQNISLLPVIADGQYRGAVSVNEVSSYLVSQSGMGRPVYEFLVDNLAKVIPGIFLQRGQASSFRAPLMAGAMPYEIYTRRIQEMSEKPVLVVGNRPKILEHAVACELPAIVIAGLDDPDDLLVDVSNYTGTIFISSADTAESLRLLRMSVPVYTICNTGLPAVQFETDFEEAKHKLMNSEYRGLPVFRDSHFTGIVTRRSFLEKPRKNLIMVDHNELHQSIPGADQANVLEIIDHHRFGAPKTNNPIYISAKPVGSSSTIVYQHFRLYDIYLPPAVATLLFSGILSDTVNMKSPTATPEDAAALQDLSVLTGLNPDTYAQEMFSQLAALKERDPREIVLADFKSYSQYGRSVGIGQVEVIHLEGVQDLLESFVTALDGVAREKQLDWSMLLITDVLKQNSLLVSCGPPEMEERFVYQRQEDGAFLLPNILSRKKQLLPEVLRVLEESMRSEP